MNRRNGIVAALGLILALMLPSIARAGEFGIEPGSVTVSAVNSDGTQDTRASSHPYAFTIGLKLKTNAEGESEGGRMRDLILDFPPGWIGNPQAIPVCSREDFEGATPSCPPATQVGVVRANSPGSGTVTPPLYNISAGPGAPAQFGFAATRFFGTPVASLLGPESGYGLRATTANVPIEATEVTVVIWGVPADEAHKPERNVSGQNDTGAPSGEPEKAFLTLPAECGKPIKVKVSADSTLDPGNFVSESGEALYPGSAPADLGGCEEVPFSPAIASQLTAHSTTTGSGLDFELKLPNEGLEAPAGTAETEPRTVSVALPEGVSINPSVAEGIDTCSSAGFAAEALETKPSQGCPEGSKLGSVFVQTPLLKEPLEGSLFLASPYENQFGTLGAVYMVARNTERGVFIKQAGKIEFNQATGQITTTFDHLPPVPFSDFKLHFREGARAPLVSPQACGEYVTRGQLTPFSSNSPLERQASFQIERGPDGGACPTGGTPPFHPGLIAGSINNAAGHYSPFNVRMFRNDAEQEITHFSIKLPPGITGKLAGLPYCPEAAIAAAKAREGTPHGGQEELNSPSCPAASEVGHSLVGAGVGSALAYVPGKIYLAGPYHGSNLSVVAITAAKAGPFDLGTVVVRQALRIDPETAEVFIDGQASDPIPHIIAGIPVHLRDIRAYVDRPDFVLNPTSCRPTSTASTLLGSGTNFATEADDQPVTVTTRYQAADCASLPFGPKLALSLKGGTKRGDVPAFKAVLTARKGEANTGAAQITLPHSEFLEQAHIGTVCTRVQFKEGKVPGEKCPAASVYGKAEAITPILSEPLKGPVYLRSSSHPLPDLVATLHNAQVDIVLAGRIDSVNNGRIRNTFEAVPDAPVTKFVLEMQGGKKGLLVNSTDLCKRTNRALSHFTGQNGKVSDTNPALVAQGCKKAKKKKAGAKSKSKSKSHKRAAKRLALRSAW